MLFFFFSCRRRHTRCALVTGVQTCALPISYRKSDFRGGANGARVRLAPQKDWEVNEPAMLAKVLDTLDGLRGNLSLADAIVLGGVVGLEKAIKDAGFGVAVPFTGGRGDAPAQQTAADSFAGRVPAAEAFRTTLGHKKHTVKPEEMKQ